MKYSFFTRRSKLLFLLPALIVFSFVVFYCILQVLLRSMYEWDGINIGNFIGLSNYFRLFQDKTFYIALKNGLIFAGVLLVYQVGIGLLLALLLNSKGVRGSKFFSTTYFIPVVLSVTVVAQLWISIFHGQFGILNKMFTAFGIPFQQDWLGSRTWAIVVVALSNAWQYLGIVFIIFYSAIKSIPEQYYEAAMIDGASRLQTNTRVIMPLLSESMKTCVISAVSGGINAFTEVFMITSGGPGKSTYTLTYMMYSQAFRQQNFGYGCAIAVVLILEGIVLMCLINRLMAREQIIY